MEEVGDPPDLLGHDDAWLISWLKLSRTIILELCMELASVVQRGTRRNRGSLVPVPVLSTVLSTGVSQRELTDSEEMISECNQSYGLDPYWYEGPIWDSIWFNE
ncbi:hypothetical protein ILYODFUR_026665 [Ilyodon furcidens]|uniref:Uncharacterized protein n=1 Tax=Ilyodon furcidens TaxID=33524 RepID=A0ABV0T454_9TELE